MKWKHHLNVTVMIIILLSQGFGTAAQKHTDPLDRYFNREPVKVARSFLYVGYNPFYNQYQISLGYVYVNLSTIRLSAGMLSYQRYKALYKLLESSSCSTLPDTGYAFTASLTLTAHVNYLYKGSIISITPGYVNLNNEHIFSCALTGGYGFPIANRVVIEMTLGIGVIKHENRIQTFYEPFVEKVRVYLPFNLQCAIPLW